MAKTTSSDIVLRIDPGAHCGPIESVIVNAAGTEVISAGRDKSIRIWDVTERRLKRTLLWQMGRGRIGEFCRMALDPGEPHLFIATRDVEGGSAKERHPSATLRVFDTTTGDQKIAHNALGWISGLSLDETTNGLLMVDHMSNVLRMFDPNTLLTETNPAPFMTSSPIRGACRRLRTFAREGSVWAVVGLWGDEGGVALFEITAAGIQERQRISLPDGDLPGQIAIGESHISIAGLRRPAVYIFDKELAAVRNPIQTNFAPAQIVYSSENRLIVGTTTDDGRAPVQVFDGSTGYALRTSYFGHRGSAEAVAFLPDGVAVSAGGPGNEIHFWKDDGNSGELLWSVGGVGRAIHATGITSDRRVGLGHIPGVAGQNQPLESGFDLNAMTASPLPIDGDHGFARANRSRDGLTLAARSEEKGKLFLEPNGVVLTGDSDLTGYLATTFGFTPAGSIITGDRDGDVRRLVVENGKFAGKRRFLHGHEAGLRDHAAAGDWLITGGLDQVARLWYLPDVEAASEEPMRPALSLFLASNGEWVVWSESGFFDASQFGDRYVGFHVNQGNDQESQYVPTDRFVRALFRPSLIRAILETGSEARALALTGVSLPDLPALLPPVIECNDTQPVSWSAGKRVDLTVEVRPGGGPIMRVWALRNEVVIWEDRATRTEPHTYESLALALVPGENRIKLLAESMVSKACAITLVVNPEGGPAGITSISEYGTWSTDTTSPPIEANPPAGPPAAHVSPALPLPKTGGGVVTAPLRPRRVKVSFDIPAREEVDQRIQVLRNGKPVRDAVTRNRRKRTIEASIAIPEGQYDIEIVAGPKDKRSRVFAAKAATGTSAPTMQFGTMVDQVAATLAQPTVTPPPAVLAKNLPIQTAPVAPTGTVDVTKPELYVLAIGVSRILHPSGNYHDLKFAAADAVAIGKAFENQNSGLFGQTRVWLLTDEQATLARIEAALAELEATVAARAAARAAAGSVSRDVTVIALAGHGVQTKDDQFFFWNHDFDLDRPAETGMSFLKLGDLVTAFPTELVLLIDACHAGMAGAVALSNLRPEELFKRLSAINERAQTIFSATQKNELAMEHAPFGHGLFTKAILDALNMDPAGVGVSLLQMVDNTQRLVRGWSDGKQVPSMRVYGDVFRLIMYRK